MTDDDDVTILSLPTNMNHWVLTGWCPRVEKISSVRLRALIPSLDHLFQNASTTHGALSCSEASKTMLELMGCICTISRGSYHATRIYTRWFSLEVMWPEDRPLRLVLSACMLSSHLLLMTGCGSGESLSEDRYFRGLTLLYCSPGV